MILQRYIPDDLLCVRPKCTETATDLDPDIDPEIDADIDGPFDPEIEKFFASSSRDEGPSDWKSSGGFDQDFLDSRRADQHVLRPASPLSPPPRSKGEKTGGKARGRGTAKSKKKNAAKRSRGSKPKRWRAALSAVPAFTAEQKRWINIDLCGPSWRTLRAMELLSISPRHPELRDQPRRRISKESRAFIVDDKVQWLNLRWRRLWRGRLTGDDLEQFNDFLAAVRIQDQPALRLRIEAGIIADVSQHQIATATNLPLGVIAKYEDYVFDVRNCVPVRQELLERFLPAEYTDDEKQFSLFILLTARNAGVYAYRELLRAIDQLGLPHDLSTEVGRKAERSEILYELFKYRREQLSGEWLIHLLPKDTNRFAPAAAMFQDSPRYQSLGGAIRQTAEVGFDRWGEQIKAMPQGIDRLPRANRQQPIAIAVPVASPKPLASAQPPMIEIAEPSPAPAAAPSPAAAAAPSPAAAAAPSPAAAAAAAKTIKRSGQDRGDDAAPDRKRA